MSDDLTTLIAELPAQAVIFSAVLSRVGAMVVTMPGLEAETPTSVRAALAVVISLLMFPVLDKYFSGIGAINILDPGRMVLLIGGELLNGALIGWLAQLMALSFPIAAQILSTFTGLSNVLQPDPALGSQETPPSRLASILIPVVLFSSNLYVLPLRALAGSYNVFPPGYFPLPGDAARSVAETTSHSFLLAFQLAMPFVLIGALWPAMLGLLNRFSPSLQIYYLAMPAQMLGGILLLALFIRGMLETWTTAFSASLNGLPGMGVF
ncbi:putative flagellar biosynthetic protein fliR [Acetobacter nitrogenifigens DSM 23921 = NBRC 105050]|uniref:Flagellar biosynthetic protein FliR n=1 Tax=Acetobacter nitrogenifigens DSM 23921 = NBRC 105050 TaxID=1120919 RepID=A0A511XB44_9PROT|nr:flagellar biosynthetic protein FliR [Acetobacter nitrogenifigens]GBQ92997.1 putative flagellar biosynthetic protein fliR [Acetobacter nitrogenifigens DSM 23921 = NBRC 105050]GEN60188.1 flagellar biosynthetic protein FliR [Acetobacter nitrogenifigens DSM 23921 = NBRC 105050]